MNEKIAWYQEILELEPSSKVFFALARLLRQAGSTLKAIEVLRTGLSYHKDFLEARLMLIELLYSSGNETLRDAEVHILLDSLGQYPQFWQAWSACIANEGAQNDLSLAMRFIAASHHCAGLSFASLLDKGLQNVEAEFDTAILNERYTAQASPSIEQVGHAEAASSVHDQTVEQDVAILLAGQSPQTTAYPFEVSVAAPTLEEETKISKDVNSLVQPDCEQGAGQKSRRPCEPNSLSLEGMVVHDYSNTEIMANDTTHILRKHSAEIQKKTCFALKTCELSHNYYDEQTHDSTLSKAHAPCCELFSLRTRSMAEVLVSQGDIQAALSIYEDLLLSETSEVRRSEIGARIEGLRQNKVCMERETTVEEPFNGKDKLLQMLTLLAERLETRAQ